MYPALDITLELPESLFSRDSSGRLHNRLSKQCLQAELDNHHRRRMQQHFSTSARRKYGYAERDPDYVRMKLRRFHSRTDLVKTHRTRLFMLGTKPRQRLGGNATDGTLSGRLFYRFPFPGGTGRARKVGSRQHVGIEQMKKELEAFSADEIRDINTSYGRRYATEFNRTASQKQRRKI